ncbi:hypothetical protein MJ561_05270 [Klebsiella pneumoniae]|nr:hypothetical protein MJ561_05270 [Klebsiella pneumoniae]
MGVIFVLAIPSRWRSLGTVVVLFVTTLAMLFSRRREAVAVHRHIGMGISAVVLLILAEPPYSPRDLLLEPVRPVRQRLPADPVADGFRPRRDGAGPATW